MAEQTSTLQVKGKLGNVVGYKGRGKQLARIRVTSIKNPNSVPQAIQRMITATNARAYARMKTICDHSFEGVAYKQASQDYFLKQNAKILRQWVADQYPDYSFPDPVDMVGLSGKSAAYGAGVGLLISKGSIPAIQPVFDANAENVLVGFGSTLAGTKISDVLAALGAEPGDQITLVGLDAIQYTVRFSRYVLNTVITAEQAAAAFNATNLAAILDSRSIVGELSLGLHGSTNVTILNGGVEISDHGGLIGAAIILSRKASDGSWLRSTQKLIWCGDNQPDDLISPTNAIPEWVAGTTEIDTQSEWYLNQSRAANASF